MISPLALERGGWWRGALAAAVLLSPMLPTLPLWSGAFGADLALDQAFLSGLWRSGAVGLAVALAVAAVGLPLGVAVALYEVPARPLLLCLAGLPLLLPSFLPALGWSALAARLGPRLAGGPGNGGVLGVLIVYAGSGIPLVLLTAYAASLRLASSQLDAARLAGGERAAFGQSLRWAAPPALLAAGLVAVLSLSDPGPGMVFGVRSAASEILTGFSALFDFARASRQCLVLAAVVLVLAVSLALPISGRLASPHLGRVSPGGQRRSRNRVWGTATAAGLGATALLGLGFPLLGLLLPLVDRPPDLRLAAAAVLRTGADTLLYGFGAGLTATGLGLLLALLVGRSQALRRSAVAACVTLVVLPPTLSALGLVRIATDAPAWLDVLLRSRLTVVVVLGLRSFPVAAVLALRTWGEVSPSWTDAAAVHGVPLGRYLRAVVFPSLLPTAAVATLLAALLATADVSTVLLLHPPGRPSLPLAIFAVMANAPESLVASLCLLYVLLAAAVLAAVWWTAGRRE
jgi:iron(III) transport system permease protein